VSAFYPTPAVLQALGIASYDPACGTGGFLLTNPPLATMPATTRISLGATVDHLLAHKDRIPNRALIACLALMRLKPQPTQRVQVDTVKEAFGCTSRVYVSHLLAELRRHDLVEYQAGVKGETGYLFLRVGPREAQS
jgi:hypothetical protein